MYSVHKNCRIVNEFSRTKLEVHFRGANETTGSNGLPSAIQSQLFCILMVEAGTWMFRPDLNASLSAHDLYLIPERFVVQGAMLLPVDLQNGDSFPESEISPVLERVRDMRLLVVRHQNNARLWRVHSERRCLIHLTARKAMRYWRA